MRHNALKQEETQDFKMSVCAVSILTQQSTNVRKATIVMHQKILWQDVPLARLTNVLTPMVKRKI
jgi:hypothetical protein